MRILIYSTAYLPLVGGAEIAIKEITDRLPDHEFELVTARLRSDLPREETIGRVRVHRFGSGSALDRFRLAWFGSRIGKKLHREKSFDLVWGMMASWGAIAAVDMVNSTRAPFLLTLQEGDEEEHLHRYAFGSAWLYRHLIRPWHEGPIKKADRIQVISESLKNRAIKSGARGLIDIVPNGVPVAAFSVAASPEKKEEMRRNLTDRPDGTVLITVSRLVHKNAIDDLIRTLPLLSPSVTLAILGSGPDEQALRALAEETGTSDRVRFLGQIAYADLPAYLRAADIFVRASRSEGFGNSFIEAMAAGIPVVATPVGGIVDFLTDPADPSGTATGWFAKPNDPASIAAAVNRILADRPARDRVVANARAMVAERYDWDIVARMMDKSFAETISKGQI